jgi:pimeloyl-ACP methyl ester carboxylesterase
MTPHRFSPLGLLAALTLGLATAQPAAAAGLASCPAGNAADETFFATASTAGTTAPGDVARCRQITLEADTYPAGTRAYQLIYRSSSSTGQPIAVSGSVLVPAQGATNVISLATGTVGMADKQGTTASCAPSAGIPKGSAFVSGAAADYLAQGYAVAVTDYEGLRTPGVHTYLNGRSAGQTMIDVVRAAGQLPNESLQRAKVVFTGYSQGGQATMWAAHLAGTYGQGVRIAGAVAGGVPVVPELVRRNLDGAFAFGLTGYILASLSAQYPELRIADRLDSSGRSFVSNVASTCSVAMALDPFYWFDTWASLWKPGQDPAADPAFQARLAQANVPAARPTVPVAAFHGRDDGIIPIAPARDLVQSWMTGGAATNAWFSGTTPRPVVWAEVSGSHLLSSNANGQDASKDWVAAQFAALR